MLEGCHWANPSPSWLYGDKWQTSEFKVLLSLGGDYKVSVIYTALTLLICPDLYIGMQESE